MGGFLMNIAHCDNEKDLKKNQITHFQGYPSLEPNRIPLKIIIDMLCYPTCNFRNIAAKNFFRWR
jgi:hypothetical protein